MKKHLLILGAVLLTISPVFSQTGGTTAPPSGGSSGSSGSSQGGSPGSSSTPNNNTVLSQSAARQQAYEMEYQRQLQQRMVDDSFRRLRDLEDQRNQVYIDPSVRRDIDALYRKSSKKDLATIPVNAQDRAKYAEFLRDKNSGLIKLAPNFKCAEDSKVIDASESCLKYTVPGAGASYSFRSKDYKIQRLADLIFTGNDFRTGGVLSQGIMTAVGDVPLEQVNLQMPALAYMVNFKADVKFPKRQIPIADFQGFVENGFEYGRSFKALNNLTYVLRSIAYRGEVYRAVSGITYNEMGFDKRRDVIVAFRIVRRGEDGSATVLWRELSRRDSPEMEKSDRLRDGFEIVNPPKENDKKSVKKK